MLRANALSTHPIYMAQRERLYEGMVVPACRKPELIPRRREDPKRGWDERSCAWVARRKYAGAIVDGRRSGPGLGPRLSWPNSPP